ncbi:hypothetical protein ACTFQ8_24810 [Bacillus cereus group sp. MYBK40-2]|uniref:hypothetical protein n=1 Tax=Bacillus cereus group TaxID=86661 RepID=UPI000BF8D8FC|nr:MULTISPECIES: hypothetical protein [Bacillus cereus group]PEQ03425.1 hypothetical protein CN587_17860 [Bacillus wiedmannii]RXG06562.1 hypothetical protein EO768_25375 [Bacillus cereus]HDR7768239.1 hypothetical protein [Bacillus paranthracis]
MKAEEKMRLLEQAQKNNNELIDISYKLIDIAKQRNDETAYTQISEDVKFLIQLKKGYENERVKLEKELAL